MALFRRNRVEEESTTLPDTTVYDTPPPERSWTAWLWSLATLLVTVLAVVSLFYGGRWVYRKATHKPAKVATTQNQPTALPEEKDKSGESESVQSNRDNEQSNSSSSNTTSQTTNQTGTSSTSTSTPSSAAANASNSSNLPNTGPGDTVAIFFAMVVLAYAAHRAYLSKTS